MNVLDSAYFNYDGLNDGLVCIMLPLFPIGLFIFGLLFAACE